MATQGAQVTRRDVMKGVTGLGLAASAVLGTSAMTRAQDEQTKEHPVVGFWDLGIPPGGHVLFHADGTYQEVNALGLGSALGIWRETETRSAEVIVIFPNANPDAPQMSPEKMTVWWSIEVDDSGASLSGPTVWEMGLESGEGFFSGQRISFESLPVPER